MFEKYGTKIKNCPFIIIFSDSWDSKRLDTLALTSLLVSSTTSEVE